MAPSIKRPAGRITQRTTLNNMNKVTIANWAKTSEAKKFISNLNKETSETVKKLDAAKKLPYPVVGKK